MLPEIPGDIFAELRMPPRQFDAVQVGSRVAFGRPAFNS